MRPADTSPEAWKLLLELEQRMTPGQKLARVFEHSEFAKSLVKAGIRRRHPSATEEEVFLRYARQILGNDLFVKVYGDSLPHDESI